VLKEKDQNQNARYAIAVMFVVPRMTYCIYRAFTKVAPMVITSSSLSVKTSLKMPLSMPQEAKKKTEFSLLKSVLEGFKDGVLILDQSGTCIHMNQPARNICRSLAEDTTAPDRVPQCLLALCENLVESRDLFPQQSLVLTQSLIGPQGLKIRAKVQWLDFPSTPETCLLVMLEDMAKSAQTTALLESVQYNLTPREKDVWLLRRANHSYEEIASKLYIAVNTVKRHLKSIHAKRRIVQGDFADSAV
jgi:DNA-binding CsgD family transcriptional regulator